MRWRWDVTTTTGQCCGGYIFVTSTQQAHTTGTRSQQSSRGAEGVVHGAWCMVHGARFFSFSSSVSNDEIQEAMLSASPPTMKAVLSFKWVTHVDLRSFILRGEEEWKNKTNGYRFYD
jgi:hypothetical protein